MKNILAIIICVFLFTSCSDDDEIDSNLFPHKYVLVQMSIGRDPNMGSVGEDMDWQEYYVFDSDSTFLKSREDNDVSIEAEGTYRTKIMKDGEYMLLSYPEESEIIGSCGHDSSETLFIIDQDSLRNTWGACDGPVLSYKREY